MVFEKIRQILCEQLDVEEDDITLESNIAEDLGADSMDVVDLIMSIEDEFEIEVPDDKVEGIKTVGDVVGYIESVK
jgi:acyl carrier protein